MTLFDLRPISLDILTILYVENKSRKELVRLLNKPRTTIYDALEKMKKLDLVETYTVPTKQVDMMMTSISDLLIKLVVL